MNFIFWNTPDDITEDELDRSADTAEQNKAATMDEVARPQEAQLVQHGKQRVTTLSSQTKTKCYNIIKSKKNIM